MDLKNLAISETGFVFDPMSGATFSANRTGAVILTALRDQLPEAAILERLIERFEGVPRSAREDIADFIAALRSHALLPSASASSKKVQRP